LEAIVLAHDDDRRYGKILSATTSIVFFGTPHRGSKGATDIGKMVGTVVNACLSVSQTAGLTGTTRNDLLRTLGANSEPLKDLAISFRNRLHKLEIVTFYETEKIPPLSELVRPLPAEMIVSKTHLTLYEPRL
jgi:hypothetical protein